MAERCSYKMLRNEIEGRIRTLCGIYLRALESKSLYILANFEALEVVSVIILTTME